MNLSRLEKFIRLKTVPLRYSFDSFLYKRSALGSSLENFKDTNKGKPLVIVANGPSLNKTPLSIFNKYKSIGLNKINLFFEKTQWRPDYIVAVNNFVIGQNLLFYKTTSIPCFLAFKTRWLFKGRVPRNIYFFNLHHSSLFSSDFSKTVGSGATVTFSALQLAFYLGSNPVILIGLDHSYSYSGSPLETSKATGVEENHFAPNYFSAGQFWGNPDLKQSEENYAKANFFFNLHNRKIFDATINGKCNIFPKISIDDALNF